MSHLNFAKNIISLCFMSYHVCAHAFFFPLFKEKVKRLSFTILSQTEVIQNDCHIHVNKNTNLAKILFWSLYFVVTDNLIPTF